MVSMERNDEGRRRAGRRSRIKYIPPTSKRARDDWFVAGAHFGSPQVYDGFWESILRENVQQGFKRSCGMRWAEYGRLQ
jgi:hypothetical protein